MHLRQFLLLIGCLLGLTCAVAVSAQDILPVPPLSARVIDQTSTLNEKQRQALEAKLAALESSTGAQG